MNRRCFLGMAAAAPLAPLASRVAPAAPTARATTIFGTSRLVTKGVILAPSFTPGSDFTLKADLAAWRAGPGTTTIDGAMIAGDTITANNLRIGPVDRSAA